MSNTPVVSLEIDVEMMRQHIAAAIAQHHLDVEREVDLALRQFEIELKASIEKSIKNFFQSSNRGGKLVDDAVDQILKSSSPNWYRCEYCNSYLEEIEPHQKAVCLKCDAQHGWDHDSATWYGL